MTQRPPLPPPEPTSGYRYVDDRGNWIREPKRRLHWVTWVCFSLAGLSMLAVVTHILYHPNKIFVPVALGLLGTGWIILAIAYVRLREKQQTFLRSITDTKVSLISKP